MQPDDVALIERLNQIFSLCEAVGLPGKNMDLDDPECQRAFLLVLKANRITPAILDAASPEILAMEFFPKPGTIVEKCRPYREAAESNPMRGWMVALHPNGSEIVAPPEMVLNGRFVRFGKGNGRKAVEQERRAVDDSRLRALLDANPEERSALALGGRILPPVGSETGQAVTPDREAELMGESREWNALSEDEKRARRGS